MILFYICLCVLLVNGAKESDEDAVVSAEELEDTAGRVQRVLNAFHEVTGVLSEVPRQIWMLPLRFGLLPGLKVFRFLSMMEITFECYFRVQIGFNRFYRF